MVTLATGTGELDVRVILVGPTGLDGALRLDPGIELIRVRTPLEAIGELSSPIDDGSPRKAVVVVAPEVENTLNSHRVAPSHGAGANGSTPATEIGARIGEFVTSLRQVDPTVVVLGVNRQGVRAPASYDATVAADLPAETLRRVIRGSRPGNEPAPAPPPPPGAVPPPRAPEPVLMHDQLDAIISSLPELPVPGPAGREQVSAGDLPMVTQILKGQDLIPGAVSLIRERTGDASVEFVAAGEANQPPSVGIDQSVAWESTLFGSLRAQRTGAGQLAIQARWLAGWLRLRDQQTQLRSAAFTDPLTGAWNRRYFDRFLATAIAQAQDARRNVTVLLFDIDDFKIYNDRYGHDAGDEILRETVRLLRSVIRPTDRVCRIGGDEFAVIFHEPQGPRQEGSRHPHSVFEIAQRFQQQVLTHRFPKLADCAPGTLTISGGLATFPWDGATTEDLLGKADQLALTSKRQGKNAITFGPGVMRLNTEGR